VYFLGGERQWFVDVEVRSSDVHGLVHCSYATYPNEVIAPSPCESYSEEQTFHSLRYVLSSRVSNRSGFPWSASLDQPTPVTTWYSFLPENML
jgi:hypothetical protein